MPGVADLPLHGGRVPRWMLRVMTELAEAIVEYMVEVRGPSSVVAMLADPYWFQAFNNVIGMDWDSSGSTTVVTGVLKTITWRRPELGVLVLGGKGGRARLVPEEAPQAEELLGVPAEDLVRMSRLAARADSAFLQDGYELYHHAVIVASTGDAVVVQQGLNDALGMARRYHVDKAELEEPHSAVAGHPSTTILNATAAESRDARKAYLDVLSEGPRRVARLLHEAQARAQGRPTLLDYTGAQNPAPRKPPYYKPLRPSRQLIRRLEQLAHAPPASPEELALAPGVGPATVRALALIADIIYGVPTSTRDPATAPLDPYAYAYAIGGKDGVPYPFDPYTAMKAIEFLREALMEARVGGEARARALRRLARLARSLGVDE